MVVGSQTSNLVSKNIKKHWVGLMKHVAYTTYPALSPPLSQRFAKAQAKQSRQGDKTLLKQ